MNVMHITSSLKRGGAETLLLQLVERLQVRGVRQSVFYFHDGPCREQLQKLGVPTKKVAGFFWRYDPTLFLRLAIEMYRQKVDVVHGWLWAANFFSRLVGFFLGVPVINAVHNNVDQDGMIRAFFDRCTLRAAMRVVAVSPGVAQSIEENYGIRAPQLVVIKNGIDSRQFQALSIEKRIDRKKLGVSSDHFVIGSVGRFVSLKNYPLLIKTFAKLRALHSHIKLVLVGGGPEEAYLREYVERCGVANDVIFIVNQPAIGYYQLFDCFTLSSFKEGISIALLEAMSCGIAVVVNNPTAQHDVVTNGVDGIVTTSETAFFEALDRYIHDECFRLKLAAAGNQTVKDRFNFETMVDCYQRLYQSCAGRI